MLGIGLDDPGASLQLSDSIILGGNLQATCASQLLKTVVNVCPDALESYLFNPLIYLS